jgi:DoxX-like family
LGDIRQRPLGAGAPFFGPWLPTHDVAAFGALPRQAWMTLGILELMCTVGLIIPGALHWQPRLTVLVAALLAVESLVFIGVHVSYRKTT